MIELLLLGAGVWLIRMGYRVCASVDDARDAPKPVTRRNRVATMKIGKN